MIIWGRALACLALLALSACVTARASDIPILGSWTITKGVVAPWVGPDENKGTYQGYAAEHVRLVVTFEPTRIISQDRVLGCEAASYERTMLPPRSLFQGGLPEPSQDLIAFNLGFPKGDVPGFDVSCTTGLFSYHFADSNTLLFALDNVIYTMSRNLRTDL